MNRRSFLGLLPAVVLGPVPQPAPDLRGAWRGVDWGVAPNIQASSVTFVSHPFRFRPGAHHEGPLSDFLQDGPLRDEQLRYEAELEKNPRPPEPPARIVKIDHKTKTITFSRKGE